MGRRWQWREEEEDENEDRRKLKMNKKNGEQGVIMSSFFFFVNLS